MKFAVVKTGGKQYLVNEGKSIKIEKIIGEFKVGDKVTFDEVLMTTDGDNVTVGNPTTGGNDASLRHRPRLRPLRRGPRPSIHRS